MTIKVLVVDDSAFFRRRVTEILNSHPDLQVIGDAADGQAAIEQTAKLRPDVITMDIEMPVMDGITAVKKIMAVTPTPIIMFSSLTHDGATATLDALEAGALDFLPKKFEDIAKDKKEGTALLQERVKALGAKSSILARRRPIRSEVSERAIVKPATSTSTISSRLGSSLQSSSTRRTTETSQAAPQRQATSAIRNSSGKSYKLLAIGTSTGGPVALQKVLTTLPANFNVPIILVQHMPAAFTPAFASRLNTLCNISVKEAVNGEPLRPGVAYLAPGGKQMLIEGRPGYGTIKIMDDEAARVTYKPSVDLSFGSAAKVYGGDVLAIILTGMGADGREGSRMLKQRGAKIWAQDELSCVVYGMPQAVTSAGVSEQSISLEQIGPSILKEFNLR
ncbi:chemotaxis response regulator protein-glutamate methylesterase [Psychrosphaera sp. 1_MG-2023]|uniref:protein-glutamate methylesterase/protein-glutamine glutaminase n=1 Tax=Psychrosphaera sp. 1_MG-2023 TaxID=3062643 RepID=UPI0026E2EF5F|nr:chemotaxis response regulator protein-glutamate methylesterase [Psychrosphaera sp. 1_MG-2023]MDO6718417.1 chemotaxis response regulator protein-glutamate methylesterase [Psychrosphaera sp. 1_MG-2023]